MKQKEANDMNDYRDHINIDPGKRGGKLCIQSMRITVYDVLEWLASGLSEAQILEDYPEPDAVGHAWLLPQTGNVSYLRLHRNDPF